MHYRAVAYYVHITRENYAIERLKMIKMLCMKGGNGDTSYANNSLLQKQVITITMPVIQAAMTNMHRNMSFPVTKILCMADLGCSSGPNTIFIMSELVRTIYETCEVSGHKSPEFQIYLNDLPGNDFNTLFKSLQGSLEKMVQVMGTCLGPCFFMGTPGSFYGRLFPSKSLNFVHSSYSLMWLSQVPQGIENNKENICIGSTSPPNVLEAYYKQFQKDFSLFLRCSEEIMAGGQMVMTIMGRKNEDRSSIEGIYTWELLAMALNQMVSEEIIEKKKMEAFNVPLYTPSTGEVKLEVEKEGSFIIDYLEVSQVEWSACNWGLSTNDTNGYQYDLAQCMRAVAEPMLAGHFGESIIDQFFHSYDNILCDRIIKENPKLYNVTVVMVKK
ncbi:S-adenosyl-L-methionine:benzoic acid/salicylic acid carboxyl methyltransferase 1-like [Impatiens glandulifera]|uniref:S-adenosyl-L-methionine:benzoic acid/salicylic acid carboxyl methyltransferase 1-like n=1 Tax=Impatiens glandulifera TaxID=253017 RepID=UPI001FB08C5F|nr:S-adenosyl-L-methionine:benzoic acid/salicylic acid carboxyl methyltransferase 1-like [Impatiens glandulifera]